MTFLPGATYGLKLLCAKNGRRDSCIFAPLLEYEIRKYKFNEKARHHIRMTKFIYSRQNHFIGDINFKIYGNL